MNSGHSVDTPISDKGYILWNIEILWTIYTLLILKDNDSCWSILGTYEYLTKRAIPSGIDVTFVDCNNIPHYSRILGRFHISCFLTDTYQNMSKLNYKFDLLFAIKYKD
jgi:hypothetical protein